MRHYWYDADADIMYAACLQSSQLFLGIILLIVVWEIIKYLLWRLKRVCGGTKKLKNY